jgi:hypothetical protein
VEEITPSNGENIEPLTDDEIFVGGVLLKNLGIVQFNVHEISEFRMKEKNNFVGANSVSVGAGIYPTVCLLNHSCSPGIVRYYLGSKMVVRALNNLRSGDLIAENYGPVFTRITKPERQETLKSRYWFDCVCEACKGDWPMYTEMCANDQLRLICSKCRFLLDDNTLNSGTPLAKCKNCKASTNILKVLKQLQQTETLFKSAMKQIENGQPDKAMVSFHSLLDQLDATLLPPYKDFHLCQEFIRRCMLTLGSHWYPGKRISCL